MSSVEDASKQRRTILVVDDDDDLRKNLADIAESYDLNAIMSGDGENAVRMSQTHQPDVVLLDVQMPGMNGLVACRLINQAAPTARIIMMSGYLKKEDVQRALGECAVAAFGKPLDLDRLFDYISRVR